MSAAAGTVTRTYKFLEASIGKKVVMAVTGCILFLFVIGHMLGNLQIYIGAEQLNAYAAKLHSLGPFLWVIRGFLLLTVLTHITVAIQLWLMNRRARPDGYIKQGWVQASLSSRTMIITGPMIAGFIIYHLLHFTTGQLLAGGLATTADGHINVYANVVHGFSYLPAAVVYIISMILLGYHLSHGVWSMFQSVGWNHPRYMPLVRIIATAAAILIAAGNISIPVAVLAGVIHL